jgi:hypothetical protein
MLNGLVASMNKATNGRRRCHGSHPQPQKRHQHYPNSGPRASRKVTVARTAHSR